MRTLCDVDTPQKPSQRLREEHLAHLAVVLLKDFEKGIANRRDLSTAPCQPEGRTKLLDWVGRVKHHEHVLDGLIGLELNRSIQWLQKVSDPLVHLFKLYCLLLDLPLLLEAVAEVLTKRSKNRLKEDVTLQSLLWLPLLLTNRAFVVVYHVCISCGFVILFSTGMLLVQRRLNRSLILGWNHLDIFQANHIVRPSQSNHGKAVLREKLCLCLVGNRKTELNEKIDIDLTADGACRIDLQGGKVEW